MIKKEYLFLHFSILLFGSAGLFTKIINLNALHIVQGRLLFAVITLLILKIIRQEKFYLIKKDIYIFVVSSAILALHWFAFFKSIQLIGILSGLMFFITYPIFTALINILFFKQKMILSFFLSLIICVVGLFLMNVTKFRINDSLIGLLWGLCSSFTFAVLGYFNKNLVNKYSSTNISLFQFALAFIVLSPLTFTINTPQYSLSNILYLVLLGSVFTALSHTLFIASMKQLPLIYVALSSCMEAVYGILLSVLFFNQNLLFLDFVGAFMVLGASMFETYRLNLSKS